MGFIHRRSSYDGAQTISLFACAVATARDEKFAALRLISASVAQQRSAAVRAVIFHPAVLPPVVILLCALGRNALASEQWSETISMLSIMVGAVIAVLAAVQFLTAAYLWEAQRVGTMRWLEQSKVKPSATEQEDSSDMLVARCGDDIVGVLVLTFATKTGITLHPMIRAWTVDAAYRNSGIGTALIEYAITRCNERRVDPYLLDFAPDHANSLMALPGIFNGVFERRDRWAGKKLARILAGAKGREEVATATGSQTEPSSRAWRDRKKQKKHENPFIFKGLMR
ncbi:hypothetical protein KEM52_000007 [Ascosphaera acerosa]|nr:hypothetical protein KEM52_000007 [Ascosphaera acerosa]